jgi:hypothetical protein
MVTAILAVAGVVVGLVGTAFAAGAVAWARATYTNTDFLLTQVLQQQAEQAALLEEHELSLSTLEENLLIGLDGLSAIERDCADERVLEAVHLDVIDTLRAVRAAKAEAQA